MIVMTYNARHFQALGVPFRTPGAHDEDLS